MSKRRSKYNIRLYDDENTSFNTVIQSLIAICNHNFYQATQCANIVHNTGSCIIYNSYEDDVEEVLELLMSEGLVVRIEKRGRK